jgi:hypothetical protein
MSDYRASIGEHNGILSLHVIVEHSKGDELEGLSHTHIPIDDIVKAIGKYQTPTGEVHPIVTKQELSPPPMTIAENMARPIVVRWFKSDDTEWTFESHEDLEIQIKVVELWLRWQAGQVRRIVIEH